MSLGLFLKNVVRPLRNFVGSFVDYDAKFAAIEVVSYLRMRVCTDIRALLKRRKKIQLSLGEFVYVRFQYERLSLFCFLCGCLGHNDCFCPIRLIREVTMEDRGWDLSLRALGRRASL